MNFYIAIDNIGTGWERASNDDFPSREIATIGLLDWCEEFGYDPYGDLEIVCSLDEEDMGKLGALPSCSQMVENLRAGGPEAVRSASGSNRLTSLLNVMGATDEEGRPLVDDELLWEYPGPDGTAVETRLIRCAVCIHSPLDEFRNRQFLESFWHLPQDLRECVLAALERM